MANRLVKTVRDSDVCGNVWDGARVRIDPENIQAALVQALDDCVIREQANVDVLTSALSRHPARSSADPKQLIE
jgi:hypothetical protein